VILSADDISAIQGKTVMVAGGFDPLHEGHVAYFQAAADLGLPVVCSVDPDDYVARKHRVLLERSRRLALIDALKPIAYVYASPGATVDALRVLKPKIFVKGSDWRGRLPAEEVAVCEELGIEVRYVDLPLNSSTALIRNLVQSEEEALAQFEALVVGQEMPAADNYDQEYFQGDWRTEQDLYTLESRRKIEGRHPEVVKEVFNPKNVIDMGCGPGFLLHLLAEIGIEADGLDISPSSPDMATDLVRDRIKIGSVVDAPLPDKAYDLVISREVLEHLPVRDVHSAVMTMCRISRKYVYVTTRFHPAPKSLLDVTTEFDVDPTHITVVNKNLLRTMFVLAGFRRRADLEQRMDWMDKRRVLVYERVRD
jgi:cytidyltransferase-like protein